MQTVAGRTPGPARLTAADDGFPVLIASAPSLPPKSRAAPDSDPRLSGPRRGPKR